MLQLVRPDGTVVGAAPRSACHGNPELLHSVARVLVVRPDGRLLLQRRSADKDTYPGYWDTSSAGHLDPEETPAEGARRELREELGIARAPLAYLYRRSHRSEFEAELAFVYLCVWAGPCKAEAEEIAELREWSPAEIEASLGRNLLTPGFEDDWNRYNQFVAAQQR